jgi:1-deoxy-D-xylulose-5-phosphate reductoisomerase
MKRIAVLGSTGSVGASTLSVIASHPDRFRVVGIAARSRADLLAEQYQAFHPARVAVWEAEGARAFTRLTGHREVLVGGPGLTELATHPDVDLVVVATSGHDALRAVVAAIRAGKRIALASKELLVMAGSLLMRLVQAHGTSLVPIDSEHAALLQCLQGVARAHVARVVITGSGGPLWGMAPAQRRAATREQVLAHPKWRMGPKITVDSATLMNKGLEVIEAQHLFEMPLSRIDVVIHPEAVVHALIELIDGTWIAQMSPCDMRLPIQFALSFPERWETTAPRLSLTQLSALRFVAPDLEQFPCLRLALAAASREGSACVVLNGANDTAVRAYLQAQASFAEIPRVIADVLAQHTPAADLDLEEILALDAWSRRAAAEALQAPPVLHVTP